MSDTALSASAQRVQDALKAAGSVAQVFEMTTPGRTAVEAAHVLGCDVGQIAKSIIFKGAETGRSVLVITSGRNRVDESKVAALVGQPLAKADAQFVREHTGYAIGGVPPIAHAQPGTVLMDEDLLGFSIVHPAGGTPHAMFAIAPQELLSLSKGQLGNIKQEILS